jgi:hypothetical protein
MHTMKEAKAISKANGGHFFDASAMRFFNSKIESELIDGKFFITSERFDMDCPKLFTIRQISETGQILDDLGEFQEFDTLHGALVALGERKAQPTNKEKTTWRMKISSMMRTLLS